MELLIPALSKIISYQFLLIWLEGTNHEQSSQYNQSTWCLSPLKYGGKFFQKSFSCWDKPFWQNLKGGLFYMGGQMIRLYRGGKSFINDKCIFQEPELFRSENFLQLLWDIHLKINSCQYSIELWRDLSLILIV